MTRRRRSGSGIDTRSALIGLLVLVVLAGAVATLLALRSGSRRSQLPEAAEAEPTLEWRVSIPHDWTQSAVGATSVRFLRDGLLVGGLEVSDGELTSMLPDGARIESTWVAATRWGQAVGYEVSVPLSEPAETDALVMQLTGAGVSGDVESGGRRPETHCMLGNGTRTVHLWTRENVGFGPPAASAAAVSLLASLEPVAEDAAGPPSGPVVRLIKVAPATADAEVSGPFDVQVVVTNGSVAPVVDTLASLGVESVATTPRVQPLPKRTETIARLQPGQSVTLVAPAVKLPEQVSSGAAFRVHAEVARPTPEQATLPQSGEPGGGGRSGGRAGGDELELTITALPTGKGDNAALGVGTGARGGDR